MVSTEQTRDHSSNKELCLFGTPPNLGNGENWLRKAALTRGWGPAPMRSISESPGRFRTTWSSSHFHTCHEVGDSLWPSLTHLPSATVGDPRVLQSRAKLEA